MLNVANLRKSSLWLNADLICSESLFSSCNRQPRLARKREKFGGRCSNDTSPTDVFLSADKFPCSSTKTNRNLSVAAFLKTNPGSLGHLAVGKGAKVSTRRILTSSSSVSVPTSTRKSLEVDGGGVEGSSGRVPWYRPALQQCRALGITTSRCPSPGRGGPPVLSLSSVTFK